MANYPPELSWLPDWKESSEYPPAEECQGVMSDIEGESFMYTWKTPMTHWAWEFLRRNPEYQKAYRRWEEKRTKGYREGLFDPNENIWTRFHLVPGVWPPDPKMKTQIGTKLFTPQAFSVDNVHRPGEAIFIKPDKNTFCIEFNTFLPNEIQLKKARELLAEYSQKTSKFRSDKLPDYLRILDAKQDLSKPSLSDIAQVIYSNETCGQKPERYNPVRQKVEANLKAALLFRDVDFWRLPSLA